MEMSKKRVEWVDVGKGICMLFVILSHSSLCPMLFRRFFSPFFLSGFFFLSGYVYRSGGTFKSFIIKKAKTLLIPWAIFSVFEIILVYMFGSREMTLVQYFGCALLQVKGFHETLWFLPCIFISYVPFFFFEKHLNDKNLLLITTLLCIISRMWGLLANPAWFPWGTVALPWHVQIVFVVNWFMALGNFYAKYENSIRRLIHIDNNILFIGLTMVYILALVILYAFGFKSIIELNTYKINIFIWIIFMLIGLVFVVLWSQTIKPRKWTIFIGRNSMLYFCLHVTLMRILTNLIEKFNLASLLETHIVIQGITAVIEVAFVALILVIPVKIINKYFQFIIGKF